MVSIVRASLATSGPEIPPLSKSKTAPRIVLPAFAVFTSLPPGLTGTGI